MPAIEATPVRTEFGETAPESAQSLTSFDWLETIADELVAASDRRHSPADRTALGRSVFGQLADHGVATAPHDDADLLRRVVFGYSPIIDKLNGVIATRLTVAPLQRDTVGDAASLLQEIAAIWPDGTGAVSVNLTSETLLNDLLRSRVNANVLIEIPAFIAGEPANAEAIRNLASRGNLLLLKGRPLHHLPAAVIPCFKWSIIDVAEDRRTGERSEPTRHARSIPFIHTGVTSCAQLRRSFELGAIAVIGWPANEVSDGAADPRPDLRLIMELINRLNRRDAVNAIESTLVRDVMLTYRLLRQVQAMPEPAAVQIRSIHHAIAVMGYRGMRNWLVRALPTVGDHSGLRPENFASLRRAILMRQLHGRIADAETRAELFLCGLFSLLDRAIGQRAGELWAPVALPERVRQALVDNSGPFLPYLDLARAIESGVPQEIRAAADHAFIEAHQLNRAVMLSLGTAAFLERGIETV